MNPPVQRLTSVSSTSKPSLNDPESSDDPIDCLGAPTLASREPIKAVDHDSPKIRDCKPSTSGGSGLSSSRTAEDGDATARLYKRLEENKTKYDFDTRSDGTDTIDNYSDDTPTPALKPLVDKPPSGNVRRKIVMYEQNRQIAPTIDLSKPPKLSRKDAMKSKSNNSSSVVGTVMSVKLHSDLSALNCRRLHSINQKMRCRLLRVLAPLRIGLRRLRNAVKAPDRSLLMICIYPWKATPGVA